MKKAVKNGLLNILDKTIKAEVQKSEIGGASICPLYRNRTIKYYRKYYDMAGNNGSVKQRILHYYAKTKPGKTPVECLGSYWAWNMYVCI